MAGVSEEYRQTWSLSSTSLWCTTRPGITELGVKKGWPISPLGLPAAKAGSGQEKVAPGLEIILCLPLCSLLGTPVFHPVYLGRLWVGEQLRPADTF